MRQPRRLDSGIAVACLCAMVAGAFPLLAQTVILIEEDPQEKLGELEAALVGVPEGEAGEAITRFYEEHGIESPGVTPADLALVLS